MIDSLEEAIVQMDSFEKTTNGCRIFPTYFKKELVVFMKKNNVKPYPIAKELDIAVCSVKAWYEGKGLGLQGKRSKIINKEKVPTIIKESSLKNTIKEEIKKLQAKLDLIIECELAGLNVS